VSLYFRTVDTHLAYIVLENRGESTAENVRVVFDPPLQSSLGPESANFFDVPKVLSPHSELAHGFDVWHQYFGKAFPLQYTARVTYIRTDTNREVEERHILDAAGIKNLRSFGRKGVHEVAEALEKHSGWLEKVSKAIIAQSDAQSERHAMCLTDRTLEEEIQVIESIWGLFQHHSDAPGIWPDRDATLGEMRRHVVSAIVCARTRGLGALEGALQALHGATLDHRFRFIADQSDVHEVVEQSLAAVRGLLPAG